ncbi:class I SAM-dependent DNA methyltransferase [Rhizobium leguminosarum]|uniref:DNA methyltransferase n=1 Tax=Rhizobium leguminosarum TaxID=384 RepID=UPI001C980C9C|nr:DNA methyltransferase [Rhizobium leguminosarum]MBY5765213.1 class I SAM-dependent DNA methyltransferase [Rhizobium leguminosarum]
MSELVERLKSFVEYAKPLGDEKGEAQVFCDRLFQAFGHGGYKEAGASLEHRITKASGKGKTFADLMWKPIVLIEMKSKSEKLHLHYQQAFNYWLQSVPNRPRYVILCNFKEFWIYDFDKQMGEPVDTVALEELPQRYTSLNFLLPTNPAPIFGNDREKVSREAADKMAELFKGLVRRPKNPVPREQAQRFVLQLLVAMFAEDIDLMPAATIQSIYNDCQDNGQSAYDLFGSLFRQMNDPKAANAGRFKGVRYFNGGLFAKVEPIELDKFQLDLIGKEREGAATKDWSKVNPAIFGTLFQDSMDANQRHAFGAHYTYEADIQRIVGPTIVTPWRERIDAAKTFKELVRLRQELAAFRVLDPSCGSGNFLYVAFREMTRLDLRILQRMKETVSAANFAKEALTLTVVSPKQFYGLEIDGFGVELAKVTLMLAKKLALDEAYETIGAIQGELPLSGDALPLDNLDDNIKQADALLTDWPEVEAVIGNPPYQSKNKRQAEMDLAYLHDLRDRFPDVDGRADYCVYWFRIAHDRLKAGQRAGLVGTNTIRENYSREASLDYIVQNGGTITEAMSSMPWPGQANVHVSIVNWLKGTDTSEKRLFIQEGTRTGQTERVSTMKAIGPSLSFNVDVTTAKTIKANAAEGCYQGQTHGHKGFLIKADAAKLMLSEDKSGKLSDVIRPFMIANDLIGKRKPAPGRYVIDFTDKDILTAQGYEQPYEQVERVVLPARQKAAAKEEARNLTALAKNPKAKVNRHHANFLRAWWVMSYPRVEMVKDLSRINRYIVCGRVTKRPIFEFLDGSIRPNDALQVFALDDDYSFGILQSAIHWQWFVNRCSTLTERFRYTSNTVWDSFPWPQSPTSTDVEAVSTASLELRQTRTNLMAKHSKSLRELYRSLELPGEHPLKIAHSKLDVAVRTAYGMTSKTETLQYLLNLNKTVADAESKGQKIQGPGLPQSIKNRDAFVTEE